MIKQGKISIFYRFKKKPPFSVKGLLSTIILGTLALAMGIFFIFIEPKEGELVYKIVLISLMVGSAIFCYAFIPAMIGIKKKIKIDNICFFENKYDEYEAEVIIDDKKVIFAFDSTSNRTGNIGNTSMLMKDFSSIYEKALDAVVKEMYGYAVDWNEDNEDINIAEFTPEAFREMLKKYPLSIDVDGDNYTVTFIYEKIDLFGDHDIICEFNINDTKEPYVSLQG